MSLAEMSSHAPRFAKLPEPFSQLHELQAFFRPIFERNLTAVPKESTLLQNSKMGFQKLLPHYNKYDKELNNIYELPKSPTECQMRARAQENSRPRMKVPEETTGHQGDTLKQQPTLLLNSRAGRNGEQRLPGRGHTHHAA